MSSPLAALVPTGWRADLEPALAETTFGALEAFLDGEWAQANVFPPREQIFAALALTSPADVRAVIFGQDPYPTAGNANGLAFSVAQGVKVPASLRNLFAGLSLELGVPKPLNGDLTPWARQGVLLLNTVLTVREGEANSHQRQGWEPFTRAIIAVVNAQPGPVVFFCLGKQAAGLAENLVDATRHAVLVMPHPSPLNGNAFVRHVEANRPFSRGNAVLETAGRGTIDWTLGS
jgi:uracil-DNA glycosylase